MGPAIRHAATKLRGLHAGTRLLMIISDGRPSDIDYGMEYGPGAEVEYAIRDTRAALDETRAQGIRPFLLTVDANGSDYLRQMADELDYEVLDHVEQLPQRLAALYNHLTHTTTNPNTRRHPPN
jgi:nitric oxide reductase activation protein